MMPLVRVQHNDYVVEMNGLKSEGETQNRIALSHSYDLDHIWDREEQSLKILLAANLEK